MTEFEEYFTKVYDGRITACTKMKQVSEMLLTQFAMPGKYHFDERFANAPIVFIETFCKQPTGKIGVRSGLSFFKRRGCKRCSVLSTMKVQGSTTSA